MKKYILHCHVSGEFWESYQFEFISEMIKKKVDSGAELDDLSIYEARPLKIVEKETKITHYEAILTD